VAWLQRVVQRYGRMLGISLRDVQLAAQGVSPYAEPAEHGAGMSTHTAKGQPPVAGLPAGTAP
jgi:hypothetical protein